MNYYLFIDESGDHGLNKIDPQFPIFVLCGILISSADYIDLENHIGDLKQKFWGGRKVILHSRDIRKCEREFSILFDQKVKADFYSELNDIMTESGYTVIASAIDKVKHLKKYGYLADNVYRIALSFIIERAVYRLDEIPGEKRLYIILEKRGKKEDGELKVHFQKLLQLGTYFVSSERLINYQISIHFRDKDDDIDGLQIADLAAYPIARYVMDKSRANPAFDLVREKIYQRGTRLFGLKIFP